MWIILFFIGIIAGRIFNYFPYTMVLFLGALLLFLSASRRNIIFLISGFLLFQAAHISATDASEKLSYLFNKQVDIQGRITAPVTTGEKMTSFILDALEVDGKKLSGKIRCSKMTKDNTQNNFAAGSVIVFKSKLKSIGSFSNSFGFNYQKHMFYRNVFARCFIKKDVKEIKPASRLQQYRGELLSSTYRLLDKQPASIIAAMLVGDTGTISQETRDTFIQTGLSHLLAISGTHLGIIALIATFCFKNLILLLPEKLLLRLGSFILPSRLAATLTIPLLFFYFLISGMRTSVLRALIMTLMVMAAYISGREKDLLRNLMLAAFFILIASPFALFDISFQLSFAAVGLLIFYIVQTSEEETETLDKKLKDKILQGGLALLKTSFIITAGLAPLILFSFNKITILGFMANVIFIPLWGFIILPLSFIYIIAGTFFTTGFPLDNLLNVIVNTTYQIMETLSCCTLTITTPSSFGIKLIILYILLFSLWRTYKSKPLYPRTQKSFFIFLIFLFLLSFAIPEEKDLKISFIDVGEADSILVEFPNNKTMLIDGGKRTKYFDTGRRVVAPYLWNNCCLQRVDYIVATHPHIDHYGGLLYIADNFEVGELWRNDSTSRSKYYKKLLDKFKNISIITDQKEPLLIDGVEVRFLNGSSGLHKSTNNNSAVIRIEYKNRSILLTADIEKTAMQYLASHKNIKSDIVKLPHHGAKTSADKEFIKAVAAKIAIISVGTNSFGHPSPDTLKEFKKFAKKIYRTDLHGEISITINDDGIKVTTYLDRQPIATRKFSVELKNYTKLFYPYYS